MDGDIGENIPGKPVGYEVSEPGDNVGEQHTQKSNQFLPIGVGHGGYAAARIPPPSAPAAGRTRPSSGVTPCAC